MLANLFRFFKNDAPPKLNPDAMLGLGQKHPYTRDLWSLELQQFCVLFVGDECKAGFRAHDLLDHEDALKIGVGYTASDFIMCKKSLGKFTFPVILPQSEDYGGVIARQTPGPVKGEIYIIRPHRMVDIDNYKANGVVFQRQRVRLDIPYRPVEEVRRNPGIERVSGEWRHCRNQEAWMYVGVPEYWFWTGYTEKSFAPVNLTVPGDRNKKPFYSYTPKEDVK